MPHTTSDDEVVELRFNVPRWIAEVVDAHCAAKRMNRTDIAKAVMDKWARSELHLAMVVTRVTKGNGIAPPVESPSAWGDIGS